MSLYGFYAVSLFVEMWQAGGKRARNTFTTSGLVCFKLRDQRVRRLFAPICGKKRCNGSTESYLMHFGMSERK